MPLVVAEAEFANSLAALRQISRAIYVVNRRLFANDGVAEAIGFRAKFLLKSFQFLAPVEM